MPDQVEEDVKTRRGEIIMQDQLEIVTLKNKSRVGKAYRVLVEDYDATPTATRAGHIWTPPR